MDKSKLRVVCLTSNNYYWLLKPFAYLFNIYWSSMQPVVVAGYAPLNFRLPDNFTFVSMGEENYPRERWSNGFAKLLRALPDEYIVIVLEDYWLIRTVDCTGIRTLHEYMRGKNNVLRMDLTTDRLYAENAHDYERYGHYDIIRTYRGTPYQVSLQAAIWNKELLLQIVTPGLSPWDFEINTCEGEDMIILGTRQFPVRYTNVMWEGAFQHDRYNLVPQEHRRMIKDLRLLPDGIDT